MPTIGYSFTTDNVELPVKDDGATSSTSRGFIAVGVDAGGVARFVRTDADGRIEVTGGGGVLGIVDQGSPAATSDAWPIRVTDGTDSAAVAPASTAPTALDPALVVTLSPNLAVGTALVPLRIDPTGTTTQPARLDGITGPGNSTTTPLGAGGTFTGAWEDILDYPVVNIVAFANVASATGGWLIQWSGDGINTDVSEGLTLNASAGRALTLNARARYFRTVYTNGAVAQATFRIQTIYRQSGDGLNNYPINKTITDTSMSILTRSVIAGQTTGGGGGFVNVKVTPSGALTVEIDDGGGSITVDGTVTANQGTANTTANAWPIKVTDGTDTAAVLPASTAPVAADPALVVALSPNLAVGTPANPLRIDPTGTTTQPVSVVGGSITVAGDVVSKLADEEGRYFTSTLKNNTRSLSVESRDIVFLLAQMLDELRVMRRQLAALTDEEDPL